MTFFMISYVIFAVKRLFRKFICIIKYKSCFALFRYKSKLAKKRNTIIYDLCEIVDGLVVG